MNTQTFTLLVILAIVVLFIWRVVSGSRRKHEIDREEREFNRAERVFQAQRMAEKDLSAVSDEDLLREMQERGLLRDSKSGVRTRDEQPSRERRNVHYVSEDGDVEYFPFKSDSRFEGLEIRGLNAYRERLGRVGRRSAGGWNHDVDGGDWDVDGDVDGGDWDRDEAVAAAQANLRLMREEDLNYAMDSIEAEILNMDHAPSEDELIDIADRAADAYDMSEDYRDY